MDMQRFVTAQDPVWDQVLAELRRGQKQSHWMWFVFPQLASLGRSQRARYYGLAGRVEAQAYLAHPLLARRLHTAIAAATGSGEPDAVRLFGPVDAIKFRSCLTLFAECAEDPAPLRAALDHFYKGAADPLTLAALAAPDDT